MPAINRDGFNGAPAGPFVNGFDVTPSDTVDFARPATALFCTGTGTLTVVLQEGYVVSLGTVAAREWIRDLRITRVNATGTTATGIKAFY